MPNPASVNISGNSNNNLAPYNVNNNQDIPEKVFKLSLRDDELPELKDYKDLLKGAKVLDGDIIVKNNKLIKVNYGSGAANIFTFGRSDRRVRGTEEENFESRAKFWMALKRAANEEEFDTSLEAIGEALGLDIAAGEDGEYVFKKREAGQGADALARRTIEHFVEVFEKKQNPAQQAQSQDSTEKKTYIGGEYGLRLTQEQFNGIFDQMKSRGLAQKYLNEQLNKKGITNSNERALYAKAMDTLIKECRNRFAAGGASNGLFERLFEDGLGIDAIAKKVAKTVTDPTFVFTEVSPDKRVAGGIISNEARARIDEYHQQLEIQGAKRMGELSAMSPEFSQPPSNITTNTAAKFVAELLFNFNAEEVDRAGFQGGYRIANLLLKNADIFKKVCESVKTGSTTVENEGVRTDNIYGAILRRLDEIDLGLGKSFTKMIADINTKCFGNAVSDMDGNEKFRLCCIANMDKLLSTVANSKMEEAIDTAAKNMLSLPRFTGKLPKGVNKELFIQAAESMLDNSKIWEYEVDLGGGKISKKPVNLGNSTDSAMRICKHAQKLLGMNVCGEETWDKLKSEEQQTLAELFSHIQKYHQDSKFMKETGNSRLMLELGRLLGIYGNNDYKVSVGDILLAETLSAILDKNATSQSMRRMLAAGFRYSSDGKFNLSRIMLEMGPMAHKLLQNVDDQDNADLKTTLGYIRGNLPRLDPVLVKAQLLGHLTSTLSPEELMDIEGIQIENSLGAASIGEIVHASIRYRGQAGLEGESVDVVFKLVRPDVENKFKAECSNIQKKLHDKLEAFKDFDKDDLPSEYEDLKASYNRVLSLASTVGREFDLTTEYRTALKTYAVMRGDQTVKSMGFVLKDPNGQVAFENDLQKWRAGEAELKASAKAWKNLPQGQDPTSDDVIEYIAGKHLMKSSKSCLLAQKVDGQTVDKLVLGFGKELNEFENLGIKEEATQENGAQNGTEKRKELVKAMDDEFKNLATLNTNLQKLAKKSVETLLKGKPPMLHLDLHGSNIMADNTSITLIDHGKEFNLTETEWKCYHTLLTKKTDSKDASGSDLKEAFRTLLSSEQSRYKEGDDEFKNIQLAINSLEEEDKIAVFDDWAAEKSNRYMAFANCLKSLGWKGVYVPTGLEGLVQTFEKLSAAQEKVKNEIQAYSKAKELFEVKGIGKDLKTIKDAIGGMDIFNTNSLAPQKKDLLTRLTALEEGKLEMGLEGFCEEIDAIGKGFRNAVAESAFVGVQAKLNTFRTSIGNAIDMAVSEKNNSTGKEEIAYKEDIKIFKAMKEKIGPLEEIKPGDSFFDKMKGWAEEVKKFKEDINFGKDDFKAREDKYSSTLKVEILDELTKGFEYFNKIVKAKEDFDKENIGGKKLFFGPDFPAFAKSALVGDNNTIEDVLNNALDEIAG